MALLTKSNEPSKSVPFTREPLNAENIGTVSASTVIERRILGKYCTEGEITVDILLPNCSCECVTSERVLLNFSNEGYVAEQARHTASPTLTGLREIYSSHVLLSPSLATLPIRGCKYPLLICSLWFSKSLIPVDCLLVSMSSTFNGDETAALFGFLGASSALVFSCELWILWTYII